jgi:hypothetical protein
MLGCENGLPPEPIQSPVTEPSPNESPPQEPNPQARRDPNAIEKITFADLDLPIDAAPDYQSWMLTQRVHDLTGRRVQLAGFMSEGLFQLQNVREFVLMRDRECCVFGPGATADHLIQVRLEGQTIPYTTREISVEGRLTIQPFVGSDGKTWSVFSLAAARVTEKE